MGCVRTGFFCVLCDPGTRIFAKSPLSLADRNVDGKCIAAVPAMLRVDDVREVEKDDLAAEDPAFQCPLVSKQ
jgi:hypothetical protein